MGKGQINRIRSRLDSNYRIPITTHPKGRYQYDYIAFQEKIKGDMRMHEYKMIKGELEDRGYTFEEVASVLKTTPVKLSKKTQW